MTFSEIVGQQAITTTLKNQIMAGRVGHAYLFNGGRGTGKTSAAKVLARAVNCLNPQKGEPCNECEICKAALEGSLTDIVEMDAASNNSVEDIRAIRDEVNFLPTLAKYRVYIIDEVHMLSTGAFNALLKTLEEPPQHVKFILATTEPQKLPATILSRCQRFDFKKLSEDAIIERLEYICQDSNITITQEALKLIATLSEGAMRDAQSILERCLQEGAEKIEADKIKEFVGIPKLVFVHAITQAILKDDVQEVMKQVDAVLAEGKEVINLLWEMIKYNKDILVYQTSKKTFLYTQEEIMQIEKLSQLASSERFLNIIYALSDLQNEIKWSTQKNLMFEVGMMKLCQKGQTEGIEELKKRIGELERQFQQGRTISNSKPEGRREKEGTPNSSVLSQPKEVVVPKQAEKKAIPTVQGESLPFWPNILNSLKTGGKIILYTNLIHSVAKQINDMTVGIEFTNGITSFGKTILERPESIAELTRLVSMESGKEMQIKYIDSKQEIPKQEVPKEKGIENLAKDLDIPINIIEE